MIFIYLDEYVQKRHNGNWRAWAREAGIIETNASSYKGFTHIVIETGELFTRSRSRIQLQNLTKLDEQD